MEWIGYSITQYGIFYFTGFLLALLTVSFPLKRIGLQIILFFVVFCVFFGVVTFLEFLSLQLQNVNCTQFALGCESFEEFFQLKLLIMRFSFFPFLISFLVGGGVKYFILKKKIRRREGYGGQRKK